MRSADGQWWKLLLDSATENITQYTEKKILNKQIYARESMQTARNIFQVMFKLELYNHIYDAETSVLIYYSHKEGWR